MQDNGDMKEKKQNLVEWAMHYRQIIILITCSLMAFGIYGLAEMKKMSSPISLFARELWLLSVRDIQ